MMKVFFFIGTAALLIWACSPAREASKTSANLVHSSQDSADYEILIIDNTFDQWYLMNYSPARDNSNDYYRSMNLIAVANWNDYYRNGRYTQVIDSEINYHPETDYGIEVNRKLYWYFKFLTTNYGIRLFSNHVVL